MNATTTTLVLTNTHAESKLLAEFRDAAPDWYARLSKKYGAEWDAAHAEGGTS